jgi:hypothetical protein
MEVNITLHERFMPLRQFKWLQTRTGQKMDRPPLLMKRMKAATCFVAAPPPIVAITLQCVRATSATCQNTE